MVRTRIPHPTLQLLTPSPHPLPLRNTYNNLLPRRGVRVDGNQPSPPVVPVVHVCAAQPVQLYIGGVLRTVGMDDVAED
jgi:hypothetical protein